MGEAELNWEDPALVRWLGSINKPRTLEVYKSAWRQYQAFTKKSATELITEALDDTKQDQLKRKDVVLNNLLQFNRWLLTEVPRKRARGRGKIENNGLGLSEKISDTYTQAIRSFYTTYDLFVKFKGRSRLNKPQVQNKRLELDNRAIKKLIDNARSPRDRAIILTMFQGGLDVSTALSLNYGDVSKGLESGEHPLKLNTYRRKAETEYYTFLGKDACDAIRAYLNDLKKNEITLDARSPLFVKTLYKNGQVERLEDSNFQATMRELATRSGLIDSNMNGCSQNPVSPHALRESFGKILTNKAKIPNSVVDFWLGHSLGQLAKAYMQSEKVEDLKNLYLEAEEYLSIQFGGNIEKVRNEVSRLQADNENLTRRVHDLEGALRLMRYDEQTTENAIKARKQIIKGYEKQKAVKIEPSNELSEMKKLVESLSKRLQELEQSKN
jgi:integrase